MLRHETWVYMWTTRVFPALPTHRRGDLTPIKTSSARGSSSLIVVRRHTKPPARPHYENTVDTYRGLLLYSDADSAACGPRVALASQPAPPYNPTLLYQQGGWEAKNAIMPSLAAAVHPAVQGPLGDTAAEKNSQA